MIRIPRDPQVLLLLKKPMNAYQVSRHFKDHYSSALAYLGRMERMGLIKVVHRKRQEGKGKGAIKFYRTTKKGEQVLENLEGLPSLGLNKE